MALYEVILKPSVEKDLRGLSATARARVLARIGRLREEPVSRQAMKLSGGHAWYRVRVGDYRKRKFPQSPDGLNSLLRGIQLVEHRPALRFPAGLVEKDPPIFQAAVAWGATHLLTGDLKDFGPFMNQPAETFDILVQTVAEFLQTRIATLSG